MCKVMAGEAVLGRVISALCQGDTEGGEGSATPPFAGILLRDFY